MRMSLMKSIDRWVGLVLCTLLAPLERLWPRRRKGPIKRVLVLKFWGIGSIIMAGYLLRGIKASDPEVRIDLATISSNREAAELVGGVDDLVTFDISSGPMGVISGILDLLKQVYRRQYDVVLDLEYLTRFTALVTFFSRAPLRAGFYARGFWRGNFHDVRVPFNPYWHVRENFLNMGKAAGWDISAPSCTKIDPGGEARREAEQFLEKEGVEKPYIVINPNAGETSLERRWPTDRFAHLAKRIDKELGMRAVVIGAAGEYDTVMEVVSGAGGDAAVSAAGKLTLHGLAALLEGAAAVVSNDSGPLHLACHVGTPVVGLYGPETPVLWGPVTPDGIHAGVLFRNLDRSPCINVHNMKTVVCLRKGAECLLDISADEVFEALQAVQQGGGGRKA